MTTIKRLLAALLAAVGLSVGALAMAAPASADLTYNPPAGTFNNVTIYLSRACHNPAAGSSCVTNTGCSAYSENSGSSLLSVQATTTTGAGGQVGFTARGYRVIIGTGTLQSNVANSNAMGAKVHIPLHSNAQGGTNCSTSGNASLASYNGTWAMYGSGSTCATNMRYSVGADSPGTNDKIMQRTDLYEIWKPNATSCYLESEFHTWGSGVTFLKSYSSWAWRVGQAVDITLGWP